MSAFSERLDKVQTRLDPDEAIMASVLVLLRTFFYAQGQPGLAGLLEHEAMRWIEAKSFAGRPMPAKGD